MSVPCPACAAPARLLLTADGIEWDGSSLSWTPVEDRALVLRGNAPVREGVGTARPTRLRFGHDRDLHVFVCPADPGHPPRWVLS
ncbi:hypothetical protein [Streptomyces sp. NPDC052097]|uniref:hypothetical protein n=1 Tax=Streptomyces sp. NPDC052097 TaxID=3154948 RepID=UPI00344EF48E